MDKNWDRLISIRKSSSGQNLMLMSIIWIMIFTLFNHCIIGRKGEKYRCQYEHYNTDCGYGISDYNSNLFIVDDKPKEQSQTNYDGTDHTKTFGNVIGNIVGNVSFVRFSFTLKYVHRSFRFNFDDNSYYDPMFVYSCLDEQTIATDMD